MAVKLNNIMISDGFKGLVSLERPSSLFVRSVDGGSYSLYGTLYKKSRAGVVETPSGKETVSAGSSLEPAIHRLLSDRKSVVKDLDRLDTLKSQTKEGKYDYGISDKLVDILTFLSENRIKQLPSVIVGGNLSYEQLVLPSASGSPEESDWVRWSHVSNGPNRYTVSKSSSLPMIPGAFVGNPVYTINPLIPILTISVINEDDGITTISGATVSIYTEEGGDLVATRTTNSSGSCVIGGLDADEYYAVVTKEEYTDKVQTVYNENVNVISLALAVPAKQIKQIYATGSDAGEGFRHLTTFVGLDENDDYYSFSIDFASGQRINEYTNDISYIVNEGNYDAWSPQYETTTFDRMSNGVYKFYIQKTFSPNYDWTQKNITLVVEYTDGTIDTMDSPSEVGDVWHAFDFDATTGVLTKYTDVTDIDGDWTRRTYGSGFYLSLWMRAAGKSWRPSDEPTPFKINFYDAATDELYAYIWSNKVFSSFVSIQVPIRGTHSYYMTMPDSNYQFVEGINSTTERRYFDYSTLVSPNDNSINVFVEPNPNP